MPGPNHCRSITLDPSSQRRIIARCEEVLIESCNAELRLAQQFCNLAEMHMKKRHFDHAQRLVEWAERAIAVASKYCTNPEQRREELSHLSARLAQLSMQFRDQS